VLISALSGFVALYALAVTLIASPDRLGGLLELFHLLLFASIAVAAARLDSIDGIMTGFGWGIAVSSALCVAQVLGWSPVPQLYAPAGLFGNRDFLAEAAAPVLIWAGMTRRWPLAVMLAIPIALCGSRVALLAVATGCMVGIFPKLRGRRRNRDGDNRAWGRGGFFLLAVGFVGWRSFADGKLASLGERLTIWRATIAELTTFGHGLGWFAAAHPYWEYAHSDALQFAAEFGIGAIPLYGLAAWLLATPANAAERAAAVVMAVECVVAMPFHLPATGVVAAVLAGRLARARSLGRSAGIARGNRVHTPVLASPGSSITDRGRATGGSDVPV